MRVYGIAVQQAEGWQWYVDALGQIVFEAREEDAEAVRQYMATVGRRGLVVPLDLPAPPRRKTAARQAAAKRKGKR